MNCFSTQIFLAVFIPTLRAAETVDAAVKSTDIDHISEPESTSFDFDQFIADKYVDSSAANIDSASAYSVTSSAALQQSQAQPQSGAGQQDVKERTDAGDVLNFDFDDDENAAAVDKDNFDPAHHHSAHYTENSAHSQQMDRVNIDGGSQVYAKFMNLKKSPAEVVPITNATHFAEKLAEAKSTQRQLASNTDNVFQYMRRSATEDAGLNYLARYDKSDDEQDREHEQEPKQVHSPPRNLLSSGRNQTVQVADRVPAHDSFPKAISPTRAHHYLQRRSFFRFPFGA